MKYFISLFTLICVAIAAATLYSFLYGATATATLSEPRVSDGLVLWLNATAQPAAREDAGLPPISHLGPVDFVLDSSGSGRSIVQLAGEQRPLFITDGETAYFQFDGDNDFLPVAGESESAAEVTLFILAAPKANPGFFSAPFAASSAGRNDYEQGINVDLGPDSTEEFSVLNVESAGASDFANLLGGDSVNSEERLFGEFHVITIRSQSGEEGVELFLDGIKGGTRDRENSQIGLDRMTLGSRLYSHDFQQPSHAQNFFNGAIAEVLVYNRALSDGERQSVEQDLLGKIPELPASDGHVLDTLEDPPVVQMLQPGFTVHELPLTLSNLNNVRYRHDGKLVALAYDGLIYLLSDTTGDGLEDHAELFWDKQTLRAPIGMALTPEDYPDGDGVFVASVGKVSLVLDRDGDGRADEEVIVADGWPEIFNQVDTLGVAVDPEDGSIYFGLGTQNFINPYLIDDTTGEADYNTESVRGTIQRVNADFSEQTTFATGLRFTCALAFNRHGDLFATDQEGATWLPNGNPFDELNHIEEGKHYGFPPRHPKHLPDVVDTPAVMEYKPQHQSAVGMGFNEGVNGGPHFGPRHWESDAIVTGQSRGKLWRTKMARTSLGYVAQSHQIAALSLTTVDATVSPAGDLLVICHSGPPDWGSGPTGDGRIFKIRYSDPEPAQPVLAWAAAEDEFRIAFDRPLDPADWADAGEQVRVEAGAYVGPADRFEVIRPGYQTVRDQIVAPRRWVEVRDLALSEDRRTLVLSVAPQTEPVNYAITLPVPEGWVQEDDGIRQVSEIDVLATLGGIEAHLSTPDGRELRSVLPHPSLEAAEILTAGSAEHETFLDLARVEGATLTLQGAVDVSNPFVPAVQEGSELDWDVAGDPFASASFQVYADFTGEADQVDLEESDSDRRALTPVSAKNPSPDANGLFLANGDLDLRHPLPPARVFTPWAGRPEKAFPENEGQRTDVTGDWLNGRRLYETTSCLACHTIRGRGLQFGPDLTNLVHRDRESVLKDILDPSATINPDQAGSRITFSGGGEMSGIVRFLDEERLAVRHPGGVESEFDRSEVASIEPSERSLMPDGFGDTMTDEQLEDLLTYLLINPLEPAPIERSDPPIPPARTMDEITRVLGGFPPPADPDVAPLRILLCAGPKDHGPDEHDYPLWLDRWSRLLELAGNVTIDTSMGFPAEEQLAAADVTVFYNANPGWNADRAALLDAYHERGGGAVYLHYAVNGGEGPDDVAERVGLAFTSGSRFRHGEMDLVFGNSDHPITQGFPDLTFTDETYWNMRGDVSRINVLGTTVEDGEPRPQLWTMERGQSRIVGCIPGHYTWTFDDPLFRLMVFRSICWTANEPIDRLSELITVGARIER